MRLKPYHIEATKARAIISNSNSLSCQNQNILQETGLDFIINDLDLKTQSPASLEAWTDTNDSGALHDIRAHKAVIIGKGDKEAVVHFSVRAVEAINDYLRERTPMLDGETGKPLASLSIFARHDKGAGKKKVSAMTTKTGRNVIAERVTECLGAEAVGTITPHSLRHYFVTKVVKETNNLRLAKDLARHENMQITQLYVHYSDEELNDAYRKVFDDK